MSSCCEDRVAWWSFENITSTTGQRKMELVMKETPPKELVNKLLQYLTVYPWHVYTAKWQRKEWKHLIENMPAEHAAIEIDFSENAHA